ITSRWSRNRKTDAPGFDHRAIGDVTCLPSRFHGYSRIAEEQIDGILGVVPADRHVAQQRGWEAGDLHAQSHWLRVRHRPAYRATQDYLHLGSDGVCPRAAKGLEGGAIVQVTSERLLRVYQTNRCDSLIASRLAVNQIRCADRDQCGDHPHKPLVATKSTHRFLNADRLARYSPGTDCCRFRVLQRWSGQTTCGLRLIRRNELAHVVTTLPARDAQSGMRRARRLRRVSARVRSCWSRLEYTIRTRTTPRPRCRPHADTWQKLAAGAWASKPGVPRCSPPPYGVAAHHDPDRIPPDAPG